MSTKPSAAATWDSNGTNSVPTTGGHQTDGFAASEIPTSDELNGLLANIGAWTQYVKDGSFTGGVTVDNLTVTSTAVIDGNLTVDGVILSAARRQIPPHMAQQAGGATFTGQGWQLPNGAFDIYYPVVIECGREITGWTVHVSKLSNLPSTFTAQLVKYTGNTNAFANVGGAATYSASSGYTQLSPSPFAEITGGSTGSANPSEYYIHLSGTSTSSDAAYHAEVVFGS